jgi:aerobic-type carbon monoxide dehydrogenase small subunit (CoxS/CutS family)
LRDKAEEIMQITLKVNGQARSIDADPDMPLLWALRDFLDLKGAKYGCGIGACGACTVQVNGRAMRSCVVPLKSVVGAEIRSIEGLGGEHPVQQAWLEEQVPQCGYCQTGQIMQAVALLEANPRPTAEQIREGMNGVLCRCGTYPRIEAAVQRAAQAMAPKAEG